MKISECVGGGNYNEKSWIGFDDYCNRDGGFTGA